MIGLAMIRQRSLLHSGSAFRLWKPDCAIDEIREIQKTQQPLCRVSTQMKMSISTAERKILQHSMILGETRTVYLGLSLCCGK